MGRKRYNAATPNLSKPVNHEPPRYLCVWIDRTPEEPHMPSAGVMRWDLHPDDWWEMWPELMAHPCAYLFAPKHPSRDGPPKFADWVASWPVGLDWEKIVPMQFHERVRVILASPPPPEIDSVLVDKSTVVRYAAPDIAPKPTTIDPPNEADLMLRLLVKHLLDVSQGERVNTAQLLSTLALAPDSARTLLAIKASIAKKEVVN